MATLVRPIPDQYILRRGSHEKNGNGTPPEQACFMEFEAWLAGKSWTDQMPCACPVIGSFMRSWNDTLPDDETRTKVLRSLQGKIVGTKATTEVEFARAMLCVDWFIREFTPTWLELVPSLVEHAAILRQAKPIQSYDDLELITAPLRRARTDADAAWSAAWSAAESAAWSAAESAAESAAWSAARSAARSAAWSAAWSAAESAAWSAAESAAWSAAWSAISPTVDRLQESAKALVERMIAIK